MANLERTLSGNVNIGLGVMLESIFDIKDKYDDKRIIPNKVKIENYDYHIYNIITVIRNIMQSTKGDYKEKDLINMLIDDMNYIKSTYYDDIDTEILLLIPDYSKLTKEYNKDKEFKTTKQDIDLEEILEFVKYLKNDSLKGLQVPILKMDKYKNFNRNILLTTSYMLDIDLLGNCDILESHTGTLKNRHKYYTKFATIGKRDLSHIPFNKTTHKVLGDKTLVKPLPVSSRIDIYNISLEKKWNPYTSEDKIKNDIKKYLK